MNSTLINLFAKYEIAWQIESMPSPKFSLLWPVIRTIFLLLIKSNSISVIPGIKGWRIFIISIARNKAGITEFPVTKILSPAIPSFKRFTLLTSVGAKCNSARREVNTLVPSSGHGDFKLKVLNPASKWVIGIWL